MIPLARKRAINSRVLNGGAGFCIASHPRLFEFEDNFQRHIVLPPVFLGRQREIHLDQIQVEARPAGLRSRDRSADSFQYYLQGRYSGKSFSSVLLCDYCYPERSC
jgi:hypothetical protein